MVNQAHRELLETQDPRGNQDSLEDLVLMVSQGHQASQALQDH